MSLKTFNAIGKKNNQPSVSNADREIPTLRSTDDVGNSVNSSTALSVYPRVYAYKSACTLSSDVPNTRRPFTIQFMIMSQNITSDFNQ